MSKLLTFKQLASLLRNIGTFLAIDLLDPFRLCYRFREFRVAIRHPVALNFALLIGLLGKNPTYCADAVAAEENLLLADVKEFAVAESL